MQTTNANLYSVLQMEHVYLHVVKTGQDYTIMDVIVKEQLVIVYQAPAFSTSVLLFQVL